VLGVVLVGVLLATQLGGGGDEPSTTPAANTVEPPASTRAAQAPRVPRGDITVSVLNGTTVAGLARGVAGRLSGAGFSVPQELVKNGLDQTRSATVINYGQGQRAQAREVADIINVGEDAIQPIDTNLRTFVGETADVVVTVGADQQQQ
jgi:hypothetical protein